ncbi:MAG: NAD-binding protein, partial [Candidatus Omnitrophica bacterium]|nr:NAD-binding protein [Candidatus Omnitrophota bacterium]
VQSNSAGTQVSILAALLISVAFLAVITAKITTMFIEFCMRGGSIVKKVDLSNHIIICGWNFQGEKIVKELLESGISSHREVVILANTEQRPMKDERVEFVKGDPTQDEALIRAGVRTANSVIVLNDLNRQTNEADAEALMIVLAVESINRQVHTSVQIVNSSNRRHLERAHADEIICLDQMGGNLITASAINHGISCVVTELLTFNSGSEFYRYDRELSDGIVGKEFSEVAQMLVQQRILLLGFETDDSEEIRQSLSKDVVHSAENGRRLIVVNPQSKYKICQGDALFLISESDPSEL